MVSTLFSLEFCPCGYEDNYWNMQFCDTCHHYVCNDCYCLQSEMCVYCEVTWDDMVLDP